MVMYSNKLSRYVNLTKCIFKLTIIIYSCNCNNYEIYLPIALVIISNHPSSSCRSGDCYKNNYTWADNYFRLTIKCNICMYSMVLKTVNCFDVEVLTSGFWKYVRYEWRNNTLRYADEMFQI